MVQDVHGLALPLVVGAPVLQIVALGVECAAVVLAVIEDALRREAVEPRASQPSADSSSLLVSLAGSCACGTTIRHKSRA